MTINSEHIRGQQPLAVHYGSFGIFLKKLAIQSADAEVCVSAEFPIGVGEILENYNE